MPSGFGVVEALLKRDYGEVANSRNITEGNPFAASANLVLVDGDMSTSLPAQNLFDSLTCLHVEIHVSPCRRDTSNERTLNGTWRALGDIHNTTAQSKE